MTIVFADRGLHLGVLDALRTNGVIAAADLRAIIESTGPDGPDDGYPGPGPRLAASLDLLHAVAVPSAEAAAINHWVRFFLSELGGGVVSGGCGWS
ncbi:hypothetical protein V6U90_33095, partial [Micromonospora sp. CPCC 206060]|uniref:hypothetical protein n=1 Tax=Micromonospora sp. CPCC 206060 TaxID=3122406 RepID=UPI002FF17A8C